MAGSEAANVLLDVRDELTVFTLEQAKYRPKAYVSIEGAVQRPATFTRADNMTVRDLLGLAGGLLPTAFSDRAFLQRTREDGTVGPLMSLDVAKAMAGDRANNVLLEDKDKLLVYTKEQASYRPVQTVNVFGGVQRPGMFARAENMTLRDAILLAGGLMPNAARHVEVARGIAPRNQAPDTYPITDILSGHVNPNLRDGDTVSVPMDNEIRLEPETVTVSGAVVNPGTYVLSKERERLSDVITVAGGFMPLAFPEGAQLYRDPKLLTTASQTKLMPDLVELMKTVQQLEYQRALAKSDVEKLRLSATAGKSPIPSISPLTAVMTNTSGSDASSAIIDKPLLARETVTPARQLADSDIIPGGNLNVRLPAALRAPKGQDDIRLRAGDILIVPEMPSTVSVVGAVAHPSAVIFKPGSTVGRYVDSVGSFSPDAARDRIYVIRASGILFKARLSTRVELGDVIFIPTKVMAASLSDRQSDIDTVMKNLFGVGILYAVIRSLLK